jgi:hypothetical protein
VLAFTFYVGQHALALGSVIVLAEPNRRPVFGRLTLQLSKNQFPVLLEYAKASFERIK